jgi:hypothetical protein
MDVQAKDVDRSRTAAERSAQAAIAIAEAAKRTAAASEESAQLSKRSVEIGVDSLIAQTRPYVEVVEARYDVSSSGIIFDARNSGNTTAYGLFSRYWMEFGKWTSRNNSFNRRCRSGEFISVEPEDLPSHASRHYQFATVLGMSSDPHERYLPCWPRIEKGENESTIGGDGGYILMISLEYHDQKNHPYTQLLCYEYSDLDTKVSAPLTRCLMGAGQTH